MTTRQDDSEMFRLVEAAVDGELSGAEVSALRETLAERDDLRLLESALLEMRELVRMEVEVAADSVDLDGLWDRLESRLPQAAERLDALTLQSYADGELRPAEAHRVATVLAESETARERLEALSEMGGLVRAEIEATADSVDLGLIWARLDSSVGAELHARGGFRKPEVTERPQPSWFERLVAVIGGYRSVAVSVVTAIVAVLAVWAVTRGGPSQAELAESRRHALEVRVVYINEVRSDPGYNVTVDNPSGGAAPVIYIRPTDNTTQQRPVEMREQDHGPFQNPI